MAAGKELSTTDVVLVGGGLANGLIALRLRAQRPSLRLVLLERGAALGGNHTWSFHETDLTVAQRRWLSPLVAYAWSGHEVRFPAYQRVLGGGYCSVTSERLHRVVSGALGAGVHLGVAVQEISADSVRLEDGRELRAGLVIDGRGFEPDPRFELRYQKFLGQVVTLREPHRLTLPVLMDATVRQRDGYRFVYVLPFEERQLLIEDTYYSDSAQLVPEKLRVSIREYAAAQGWQITAVQREETGVLPIVLGGDIAGFWAAAPAGVPRVGLRAMLFNHTTGFSLPEAVRLAETIGSMSDLSSRAVARMIRARARRHWRAQQVFRALNRMLFCAAAPGERYSVLEYFYRLPEPTIGRFYAGRLRLTDVARLVSGTPPVPIRRAIRALLMRPGGPYSGPQAARRGLP